MCESTNLDVRAFEAVQFRAQARRTPQPDKMLERLQRFYDALQAAIDSNDVPALKVLVPAITKKGAKTFLVHARAQNAAIKLHLRCYGAQTWGKEPPPGIVRATFAVRVAGLLAYRPELSREDAERLVRVSLWSEIQHGDFWRWPVESPDLRDSRTAGGLLVDRALAARDELLFEHSRTVSSAYAAARAVLDAAGLPFELLTAWHEGKRGEAGAVVKQSEVERQDETLFRAHLEAHGLPDFGL